MNKDLNYRNFLFNIIVFYLEAVPTTFIIFVFWKISRSFHRSDSYMSSPKSEQGRLRTSTNINSEYTYDETNHTQPEFQNNSEELLLYIDDYSDNGKTTDFQYHNSSWSINAIQRERFMNRVKSVVPRQVIMF